MATRVPVVLPPEVHPDMGPPPAVGGPPHAGDEQQTVEQLLMQQPAPTPEPTPAPTPTEPTDPPAPGDPELPAAAAGVSVEAFQSLASSVDKLASMMAGLMMQQPTREPAGHAVRQPPPPAVLPPPPLPRPAPVTVSATTKAAATELVNLLEADDGRAFRNFCHEENVSEAEAIRSILSCTIQQKALTEKILPFVRYSRQPEVYREGCPVCHLPFTPKRANERYCCNACGARAAGLRPTVRHAPDCSTGQGQEIPMVWGDNAMAGAEPLVQDHQQSSSFHRQR